MCRKSATGSVRLTGRPPAENRRCQPLGGGNFDVVGDLLSVGQVTERQAAGIEQRQELSQAGRLVEFGEEQRRRPHFGELPGGGNEVATPRHAAQHEVYFVRLRHTEHRLEFPDAHFVAGTAARRVHQDQVEVRQSVERGPHFAGGGDDLHRQVDDLGVGLQLVDGRDSVGVDGDQPDATLFAEPVVGGELGDGRRLADTGRSDQGDNSAALHYLGVENVNLVGQLV